MPKRKVFAPRKTPSPKGGSKRIPKGNMPKGPFAKFRKK